MINIDITLLIQLANFLISLAIINYLIVRPVRGMLAKRRANNEQTRGSVEFLQSEAGRKKDGYDARIVQAKAELAALREKIRTSAQKDAQSRLIDAGLQARAIHEEALERVKAESALATKELEGQADNFVRIALKTVLE